jgi:hypothetical protein
MTEDGKMSILGATTMKQYDSLRSKIRIKILYLFYETFCKKFFYFQEQGLKKRDFRQIQGNHFITSKSIIYLSSYFAFSLDFHNKKKWWYFDHGIFTLHYFSFLLLGILL